MMLSRLCIILIEAPYLLSLVTWNITLPYVLGIISHVNVGDCTYKQRGNRKEGKREKGKEVKRVEGSREKVK
jgi:hypothetical protein